MSDTSRDISGNNEDRSSKQRAYESPVNIRKVLPDNLLYSLYKGKNGPMELLQVSSDSTIRDIFSRLDENGSELDDMSSMTHMNLEWSIREHSLRELMTNIDHKIASLDSKSRNYNDKTLPLKLKDKKVVKDFNVNINLNFRVVKDENTSTSRKTNEDNNTKVSSGQVSKRQGFEEKRNTSDSIKLIQEIKGKFGKKVQPSQLSASKKTSVDREYKIVNDPYKTSMYIDRSKLKRVSNTGLITSSKTGVVLRTLPMTKSTAEISKDSPLKPKASQPNMKIHNFDKVI